eukprot:10158781-Alexandrium_andersonii.AAC.1
MAVPSFSTLRLAASRSRIATVNWCQRGRLERSSVRRSSISSLVTSSTTALAPSRSKLSASSSGR